MDLRQKLILSATRAMLGAVTPNLRGVTFGYDSDSLILRAYFDPGATEDDKELVDVALTEMISDFPDEFSTCKYEAVDLAFPAKMQMLKEWVFLRSEG